MPVDSNLVSAALAAATAVAAGVFAYLRQLKRERYLKFWAVGWCLLSLHHVAMDLEVKFGSSDLIWFAEKWFLAAAALVFLSAALDYVQKPPLRTLDVVAAAVVILWTMAYRFEAMPLAPDFGIVAVFFAAAWVYWRHAGQQENRVDRLLAAAFVILGLVPGAELYSAGPAGESLRNLGVLLSAPQLLAAALMLLAAYERQSARVEHNVLALSHLNLAASGLQSGETDKVLTQALERALAVVGFPAGAILLRQSDRHEKKLVVTTGVADSFRAALEDDALRDYVVQLTSRLGGLAVFRDLGRDAAWSVLEREEMFSRFRHLAVGQGLQTVVGISLQSKDEQPGVLLLAAPDRRELTASEFRLLAALGQQMGVAVDNSSLMQNAWRRSEELHVLNEIGQALSSTLEPDALLEKIYTEMQRLFAMADFYIAIPDESGDHLRLELEVIRGERQPKRSRPTGNHLTEYIHRTRQPILISENFSDETKKMGIEPVKVFRSYCGVPLIASDRVIGVMAVQGQQEHMFDEGHLKILRVLANQAAIAIENARLLREEQTRARHLTLLNNISRHAIAMLHPDEMLSRIAEQLERGLAFDHMGIGVFDPASKEIVIRAEAGRRRGALGRRLKLGGSLVGHVATTGQGSIVKEAAGDSDKRLVLADSASSVALPLLFADRPASRCALRRNRAGARISGR
jgi:GAF domain-containing protein